MLLSAEMSPPAHRFTLHDELEGVKVKVKLTAHKIASD
jgi:hypothetical protein